MFLLRTVRIMFCMLMFVASASSHAQDTKDLQDFFKQLKTFHARFVQQQFDAYGDVSQRSEGILWLQRPGRFRWEYQKPFAQMMLANKGYFWLYDQDLEQVTIRKIDAAMASTPLLILSNDEALDKAFNITAVDHAGGDQWYKLIPIKTHGQFEAIYMALNDDGNLIEMDLLDTLSQRINIRFMDIQINSELTTDIFNFVAPQGVDVLGEGP